MGDLLNDARLLHVVVFTYIADTRGGMKTDMYNSLDRSIYASELIYPCNVTPDPGHRAGALLY